MYIQFSISATHWNFQAKEEDGTNIGSELQYSFDDYRLDRDVNLQSYVIRDADLPQDQTWPVIAAFPFSRTIVITP